MANEVWIGEGTQQVKITTGAAFRHSSEKRITPEGRIDSIEHTVFIRGVLKDTTPSAIADLVVAKDNLVTTGLTAQRVQIYIGGTLKHDWKPVDGYLGPFVTRFETKDVDGSYSSHVEYELEIFFRRKGNVSGDNNSTVYEFNTSLETVTSKGRLVKKVWAATARGKTWQDAKTQILTYAPPANDQITTSIKVDKQQARAEGTWVWEAKRVSWVEEEVAITGGRKQWVLVPSAGEDEYPVAHKARTKPIRYAINGTVFGWSPTDCVAPPFHFSDSDTMIHAIGEEDHFDVRVYDAERGIYARRFQEIWYGLSAEVKPDHSGHEIIKFIDAPPDGSITG